MDEPVLVNARGDWTVHRYTRSELVPVTRLVILADESIRAIEGTGLARIYTCSVTGAERRWGIQ